jgi:hypothetical protein
MPSFLESSKNMAGQDHTASSVKIFYAVGILLGCFLIVLAARGDLWLDEIWSISFAEAARTPWEILSVFKHDNNHILNTFFLYFIGKQQNLLLYRVFAIISGIASLVLLVKIASQWGRLESMFVLLLAVTSYPLILYFSEARGYAPAISLGLFSFYILQDSQIRYNPVKLVLFWLASILGVLAHLTFIIVFLALAVYITHHEFAVKKPSFVKAGQIVKYLAVPIAFIIAFYFYYVKGMAIGGGPPIDRYPELAKGITSLLGLPDSLWYAGLSSLVILLSFVVFMVYTEKKPVWSFHLAVLIVVPAAIITLANPAYFHFRYVIVCFPFYYLIMSFILAKIWRADKKVFPYLAVLIIGLYVGGQSIRLFPLFQYGRGNYQAIIREMTNATAANVITVGSDNDFRNKMVLSFYSRFLPDGKTIQYIDQEFWGSQPPEWLIVHSLDESAGPEPWIQTSTNRTYRLIRAEKFSGNSGFSWFLYRDRTR